MLSIRLMTEGHNLVPVTTTIDNIFIYLPFAGNPVIIFYILLCKYLLSDCTLHFKLKLKSSRAIGIKINCKISIDVGSDNRVVLCH